MNDKLKLSCGSYEAALVLSYWEGDRWRALPLLERDGGFTAAGDDVRARLMVAKENGDYRYQLSFESRHPTRLQLRLELPQARAPFHVIPGVIFGDNNLGPCEPKRLAHLTTSHSEAADCAPHFEFRADRASHPVSAILADGVLAEIGR